MQMNHSSTSTENLFHGLPGKAKDPSIRKQIAWLLLSQSIVLLFLQYSHLQTYLENLFSPLVLWIFRKFLQRIKKTFWKCLEISQKIPMAKSYFSKVAGFYRSSHLRCSVKNAVLKKIFVKFTGKHLRQRPYFKNTGQLLLLLAFPCNFNKMRHCQQCFENLRCILFI